MRMSDERFYPHQESRLVINAQPAPAHTTPGRLSDCRPGPNDTHPPHCDPPGSSKPPRGPASASGKLAELDGLRGVAALIVVVWHFAFAFLPQRIGIVPPFDPSTGLVGSPIFALIDGPGAVILFFVLSGYVLPLGYFRSGRTDVVLQAVAKRWFRLMGLTVAAAVSSYLLFRFSLYHHREVASITQSEWLRGFGGGDIDGRLRPSLVDAILEGSVFAFVRSADVYDPVLWTMRDELFGSLLTFGLGLMIWRRRAPVAVGVLRGRNPLCQSTSDCLRVRTGAVLGERAGNAGDTAMVRAGVPIAGGDAFWLP